MNTFTNEFISPLNVNKVSKFLFTFINLKIDLL